MNACMKWSEAIALANRAVEDDPPKRGKGRPRGRFDPEINWRAAELFFIEGENVPAEKEGEPESVRWPSMCEVGRRFKVTFQMVSKHAKAHNWVERKKIYRDRVERGITMARADSRVRSIRSPLEIIEDYIGGFDHAVQDKKLRTDAVVDFDKAVRLRAFLLEQNEQAKGASGDLSLEQLQARHREVRDAELTAA